MFLHKTLPYLLYPLTWVILLMLLALGLMSRSHWKGARRAIMAALMILLVATNPIAANGLLRALEQQYPAHAVTELPAAGAIVLLGGGVQLQAPPRRMPDLNDAADRVWLAAELFHARKAPRLFVAGGQVFPQPGLLSEAEYHLPLLVRMGVPRDAITLETSSENTAENAANIAAILRAQGIDNILLVTSAYHMPRSVLLFEQAGLKVEPAVCDIRVAALDLPWLLAVLPSENALATFQMALREWMGFAVYSARAALK